MSLTFTYARIVEVVQHDDGTASYRIAVSVPGGEVLPGLIPAGAYLTAQSLILGVIINEKFSPIGIPSGVVRGTIVEQTGVAVGPAMNLEYTVDWTLDSGEIVRKTGVSTINMYAGETVHRIAFPAGRRVYGLAVPGTDSFNILDREDYAVGCPGDDI